jgi:hypothetical protein
MIAFLAAVQHYQMIERRSPKLGKNSEQTGHVSKATARQWSLCDFDLIV